MTKHGKPIVSDPEILGGTPVFRGTRVPFRNLIDHLKSGHNLDDFLEPFPSVTRAAASLAAVGRGEMVSDEEVRAWIEKREEFKPVEISGELLSETIRRGRS